MNISNRYDVTVAASNLDTEIEATKDRLKELEGARKLIDGAEAPRLVAAMNLLMRYGKVKAEKATGISKAATMRANIAAVINEAPKPVRADDIVALLKTKDIECDRDRVNQHVYALAADKKIRRLAAGLYGPMEASKAGQLTAAKLRKVPSIIAPIVSAAAMSLRSFKGEHATTNQILDAMDKGLFKKHKKPATAVRRALRYIPGMKVHGSGPGTSYSLPA